jgi:hypothetical protein
LLRLLALIAGGLLFSVILALTCSFLQSGDLTWSSSSINGRPESRGWLWLPPDGWPKTPNEYSWGDSFGYGAETVVWGPPNAAGQPKTATYGQVRYRAGFPCRAFESLLIINSPSPPERAQLGRFAFYDLEHGGTWSHPARRSFTVIPLKPVWSGLMFDAILCGVGGGALILWLSGTRRRRRLKRGQCLRCGYSLAGLTNCPECGTKARCFNA